MATFGEYFKQTISSMLTPYPLQILLYFSTFLSFHLFHHPKITIGTCVCLAIRHW